MFRALALMVASAVASTSMAQSAAERGWTFRVRTDIRGHVRDSRNQFFPLKVPVPADRLPPGRIAALQTVDPGRHAELSLASLFFHTEYRNLFAARIKVDGVNLYYRNPTSKSEALNLDELWMRVGSKPEGFDLPERTSFFVQAGKAPKIEREPVRLLESYGLASTSFSRFNDVGFLAGGTVGRNLYWRGAFTAGNPLFIRDPNALAGDTNQLVDPRPDETTGRNAGIPILYDAHVEKLSLMASRAEVTGGVGYRLPFARGGVDLLLFQRNRRLAESADLTGADYGGDLELLRGEFGTSLAITGHDKRETGARAHIEWKGFTLLAEGVRQNIAGLRRSGYELETGLEVPLGTGPQIRGIPLLRSIQPAVRVSAIMNHFRGAGTFIDPSVWWDWTKIDAGLRVGLFDHYDLTLEHSRHVIDAPKKLHPDETLLTFRIRI